MARGWESKAVEAQQEDAARRSTSETPHLTKEEAARRREKETLRLSLRRVVELLERSPDSRHRQMLEQAKAYLERKIEEPGA